MFIKLTGLPEDLLPMVMFLRQHLDIRSIEEHPTPGRETRTVTVDICADMRGVAR